ncbi:hypothetical protein RhiJN_24839 [Ceratobasidium sp. AG-Ba]|nr:hypothetical protein RhiJN_24839 [Ceratobasidium sp. AG-Ba]
MADSGGHKLKSSHFIAFPLYTNQDLREVIGEFQRELLNDRTQISGLDQSIIVDPWRLHITIGVIGLEEQENDEAIKGAHTLECAITLLEALKPKILECLAAGPLEVAFDKLDITQTEMGPQGERLAHVLFVGPSQVQPDNPLRLVMDLVYNEFKSQGYITERRSSKACDSLVNAI